MKTKKIISIVIICFFLLLAIYKTGVNIKKHFEEKRMYREAVSYINCGKVDEAKEIFFRLGNYKDSQSYVEETLKNLQKGDSFLFGKYEQDGNTENGPEPIEWIVIGRTDTKALLLSKYCIEKMPYNNRYEETTWAKSDLRKWLNTTFLDTAFSEKQAEKYIAKAENKNNNNIMYGTYAGKKTSDMAFILSEKEFLTYLSDSQKIACGSERIIKEGYSNKNRYYYWLRTPGGNEYNAMNINFSGEINYIGYAVNHTMTKKNPDKADSVINLGSFGVRPAIYLKTE